MKIGIFGGTFNPPHNGHLYILSHFCERLQFDKVLVIPTYTPPHKTAADLACAEDRLEMCRLAFGMNPAVEVSDIEIQRTGKSYTYDTLTQLKSLYPQGEFYLIIGSDMLLTFRQWYKADEILKLCTLCAADREPDISCRDDRSGLLKNVFFSEIEPFPISSSEIRDMIRRHKDISGYVPQQVADYIYERNIYHD